MHCHDIKQKVSFYLDETLPEVERHEIAHHLERCTDCFGLFESLQRFESLLKNAIYEEPPDEYWSTLPNKITNRIYVQSTTTFRQKFITLFNEFVPKTSFKWGFAGVLAIIALIIGLQQTFKYNSIHSPVIEQEIGNVQLNSSKLEIKSETTEQNIVSAPEANETKKTPPEESLEQKIEPIQSVAQNSQILTGNRIKQKKPVIVSDITIPTLLMSRVEDVSIRQHRFDLPEYNHEIYTFPNSMVINSDNSTDSDDEVDNSLTELRTYSLNSNIKTSQQKVQLGDSEILEKAKSGFSETVIFVQESKALSEKKNIWLSYIYRETEITYKSLGIYNLALVVIQIAEKTQNMEDAKKAVEFFLDNEESLRFQMGNKFNLRIRLLERIISKKSTSEN